jgi:predicted TIM-barrel fold metal-dependent hydrolase
VQVLLAYPPSLLGDRSLYPIYEAACEHGLAVGLQATGAYAGANRALVPVGFAVTPWEHDVQWVQAGQAHLLSALAQGVFERFPDLRLVLSGFGIAWLPSLLWRIETDLGGAHLERPTAMERPPGEVAREHVRFTLEEVEVGSDPSQLAGLMSLVDLADLTLFSSGYPADDGRAMRLVEALPENARPLVLRENANAFFRLGERAGAGAKEALL